MGTPSTRVEIPLVAHSQWRNMPRALSTFLSNFADGIRLYQYVPVAEIYATTFMTIVNRCQFERIWPLDITSLGHVKCNIDSMWQFILYVRYAQRIDRRTYLNRLQLLSNGTTRFIQILNKPTLLYKNN